MPAADRVQRAGGDEHRVAGGDRHAMQRGEHLVGVLAVDPAAHRLRLDGVEPADVDGRVGLGLEDQPRLRLAEAQAELLAREARPGW